MPHLPDLFRSVWDLFQSGDDAGAVAEFNRMTPLLQGYDAGGRAVVAPPRQGRRSVCEGCSRW